MNLKFLAIFFMADYTEPLERFVAYLYYMQI